MQSVENKHFFSFSAAVIFVLLLCAGIMNGQEKTQAGWQHLHYAVFFTHMDIEHLLRDPDQFKKTMEYFAPVKPVHVYLEANARGKDDIAFLKSLADKFHVMGIRTSGCLVTVSAIHEGPMVYNDPADMASLEEHTRALAQVFDEIILDDWLFTIATDEKSLQDRGTMSWADYRTKLLLEQSKKHIIDAAKQVNPQAKVIIKYPNWYEGHRRNGYDVYNETLQFDKMAVGIETRDLTTQDQHIPMYSGYIFQKWWSGVDTSKWIGSWLDNYDMKGQYNDYNAEVWQAVFAQAPEIILWCAGQLYPTNPSSDVYPYFCKELPEFDAAAGMLNGSARGVPIYLPYGSTGEYNIFGYLGMAGIPLEPVAQFPKESQSAIFTLHSLQDPELSDEMLARLRDGHDVFMTWSLWLKLQNTEFKNILSLVDEGGSVASAEFRLRSGWFYGKTVKSEKPIAFPRIRTTTWPYVRSVAAVQEDYDYGILLSAPYLKGNLYVLNMPENNYDLLRLPTEVLNTIRFAFVKELGVALEGPGNVGMYLFGPKQYVLYNMSDDEASLSLKFPQRIQQSGWRELAHDASLNFREDTTFVRFGAPVVSTVSLKLKPFEIAVIQAP